MRLITRKSQIEYARLCEVAPWVLTDIEAGKGSPTVETLGKLLRPFGYPVGVVAPVDEDGDAESAPATSQGSAALPRQVFLNISDR